MKDAVAFAVCFGAIAVISCDGSDGGRARLALDQPLRAPGENVVARVGKLEITTGMVRESAKARRVTPEAALQALIDDALAARVALDRGLDQRDDVRRGVDAALARYQLRSMRAAAIARGPLSDAELESLTARHWKEVDLPERVRVVHAVVLRKSVKPENAARAPAVAEAIRVAVASAASAEEFEKRAASVPKNGFEVVIQPLPAFASDGRVTEHGDDGGMDAVFARAAFELAPGTTSGVVATDFGWHVIRSVDRLPAERLDVSRRRELFAEEAIAERARAAYEALVGSLKKKHDPKIETYAQTAIASVQIAAESNTP